MKKFLILLAAFTLTFALAGCNGGEELPEIPEEVTMDNVDEFLSREDVQYIDLRNFDDKMKSGYIRGFEFIPFFDYLELEGILVRNTGWDFTSADIESEAGLKGLFDMDAEAIFLMCGSGTRAGYVKAALESLGYTNVYNVGGISNYAGENMVEGDGTYRLNADVAGPYTMGTYYGVDPVTGYMVVVVINAHGGIEDVIFDAMYHGTTKNDLDAGYTLASGVTWKAEAQMLADYIVANQGWKDIELLEEAYDATWTALSVPRHIIDIDVANSPDGVAGVTIGAEGFVFAWNLAIAQASTSDLGVVATTVTYQQWVDAHAPAYDYVDGVYYGYEGGYSARITIVDGEIVDVWLDALHCRDLTDPADGIKETCNTKRSYTIEEYKMNYVTNDNGTPADDTDDFLELPADKLDWWMMADKLAEAILDAQTWSTSWVVTDGDFDLTDADTADAVGGVTIGIENWQTAVEEALAEAAPAS